jgi:ketosteroid isomerase-like protein
LGLLLLAAAGVLLLGRRDPPPTETLIRATLEEAAEAARRRDVSGVMATVSGDYKDSNFNKDRLRLVLARAMRDAAASGIRYDITMAVRHIALTKEKPDTATVIAVVSVYNTASRDIIWGGQPITLVMRRETARRWLVFPEDRWRIASVVNLPPLPGFGDGAGGGFLGL